MGSRTLTSAEFDALRTSLQARFNAGLKASPDDWRKIAKLLQSNSRSNTYAWLSNFPAFREWVGARLHKKYAQTAYQVTNRKFESTVDVERVDIEDDNLGQYGGQAEACGQSATDLKNDLVFQLVSRGFTETCYDGQYFFDTDHPVYPNEDGTGVAASVSNMQGGNRAPWVLLCTKRAPSAFYLQERIAPQFDSIVSPASQQVFDLDVYSFGGRWRGEAAFGFWQCAFGSMAELSENNFNAAYAAMMKFTGDGNRKLGIVPDTLVTGPDNMAAAEALIKAQFVNHGTSNVNYNKVDLVVTPWIGFAA